jgi:predicted ATPase
MSGFPDQARQRLQAAMQLAEELSLPLSRADAYYNHAQVCHLLGEPAAVRRWGEAAVALAREHGLRFCQAVGSALAGWALAVQGEHAAGLALLHQGLATWQQEGMRSMQTYLTALLVEAYLAAGRLDEALAAVGEGQGFAIEFNEHFYEPELYRLQGRLLAQQGAPPQQVGGCYRQALELARQQGAKLLELRAAVSLARLWQQQGKRQAAHDLLAGIYGWFGEGFDIPDLKEARALLAALAV